MYWNCKSHRAATKHITIPGLLRCSGLLIFWPRALTLCHDVLYVHAAAIALIFQWTNGWVSTTQEYVCKKFPFVWTNGQEISVCMCAHEGRSLPATALVTCVFAVPLCAEPQQTNGATMLRKTTGLYWSFLQARKERDCILLDLWEKWQSYGL